MSEKLLLDACEIKKRRVSNYLNNVVKDFALYTIRTRAMPSIMDGLRVGARKIMWATLTGDLSKKQKVKMPSLTGDVMKLHYSNKVGLVSGEPSYLDNKEQKTIGVLSGFKDSKPTFIGSCLTYFC